jgi:hypothetical protein
MQFVEPDVRFHESYVAAIREFHAAGGHIGYDVRYWIAL